MGVYFDSEKNVNKSTQIPELFTFQVSKTVAWFRTDVNQNT
jgi:hypothetical protein